MHKEIILKAFNRAKEESGLELPTQLAVHISDILQENHKFHLSERTLRNHYNDILNNDEEIVLSPKIANALCQYLGYNNIQDYSLKTKQTTKKSIGKFATKEKAIIGSLIVIASYFGIDSFDKKCMTWVDDHYEKEYCEKSNTIQIDETILNNFKKISPDCNYSFFNADGSPNLWYGKSIKGDYEYFSSLAKHPVTNKSLKEITTYMIKKHICPNYPNN